MFEGFTNSIPAACQHWVRLNGKLNLAAHFPDNGNAPDLGLFHYNALSLKASLSTDLSGDSSWGLHGEIGPKAYVASDPKGSDDSKGTTKLHLDVTDAFNLMVWSADSSSPAALWHIFPAESTCSLKAFLQSIFPPEQSLDPIHNQTTYLSKAMLAELASRHDVRPWTVYQRTGDMVFIPAGCAHQVCLLNTRFTTELTVE